MPNKRNRNRKPNTAAFSSRGEAAVYLHVTRNTVVEQVLGEERHRRAKAIGQQHNPKTNQRPFSLRTGLLKGLLRERASHEAFERQERRRRHGFLPSRQQTLHKESREPIVRHPPGWILRHGRDDDDDDESKNRRAPRLQKLALKVFADYFEDYLQAMGRDELHEVLAVLPPESLAELSVLVSSKKNGVNDHLAILLAKHGHVDQLCLRAAALNEDEEEEFDHGCNAQLFSKALTDRGLLELMPQLSLHDSNKDDKGDQDEHTHVPDCWEDDDDCDSDAELDPWALQASAASPSLNIKLRRLELLDCQHISAPVLLQLFERCSGITHLSLAGSFVRNPQDGIDVLSALPLVLPKLEVLDVTRCPWIAASLLSAVMGEYESQREGSDFPPPQFVSQVSRIHTEFRPGLMLSTSVTGEEW